MSVAVLGDDAPTALWVRGAAETLSAAQAADLGRGVGAVPGAVTSASSAGCHRILRDGVGSVVEGMDDIDVLLRRTGGHAPRELHTDLSVSAGLTPAPPTGQDPLVTAGRDWTHRGRLFAPVGYESIIDRRRGWIRVAGARNVRGSSRGACRRRHRGQGPGRARSGGTLGGSVGPGG